MKNTKVLLLLLFCCFVGSNIAFAQKAKFKNLKATCQKTRLPQNYVEPENRTYSLYKKGAYSDNIEVYNRGIYGWTIDQNAPKLEAVVSLYGFRIHPSKRTAEKKVSKDKDGNVTKRWTEYIYNGSATGKGTLYIYGESNPFVYEKINVKKTKSELQREEKAKAAEEAKKKELADNPFLSAEDTESADEDTGESDISEDTGLDNSVLSLVETKDLDIDKSVKTKTYRSSSAAYKDYLEIQKPKLYDFKDNYPEASYNKALNSLNYEYGYSPVDYKVWLRKMKTEKHPEFKMWNQAAQAAQTLFKGFKYNKSIESYQAKFDPIISYFSKQVEKIDDKDRKVKKMKKAAFENLSNIMFYLERHEALITLCKKYADSKILDKAADRMLKKSDRQIGLLAFHKVKSCHLTQMADIEEGAIESEEEAVEEEAEGLK